MSSRVLHDLASSIEPQRTSNRRGSSSIELLVALAVLLFVVWYLACALNAARDDAMDDAYITYQYGRNLAEGHGLRFNAGDAAPTSGASSLLHVFVAAAAARAGLDPLVATRALGILCIAAIGVFVGLAAARATGSSSSRGLFVGAWLALGLAFVPETVVHLASGMETWIFFAVHAALIAWMLVASEGDCGCTPSFLLQAIGVAIALCVALARPEGGVLAVGSIVCVVVTRSEAKGSSGVVAELAKLKWVVAGSILVVASLAIWQFAYFGSLLPNPYYVKTANRIFGSSGGALPGLGVVAEFVALRLAPIAFATWAIASLAGARDAIVARRWLAVPSLAIVILSTNVIHEMAGSFRYEIPMLAPLVALLAIALLELGGRSRATFVATLAISGVCIPLVLTPTRSNFVNWLAHPRALATHWLDRGAQPNALAALGVDLGETKLESKATVLVSGAGQIPYWSRMRAIDWIGLNDNYLSGRDAHTLDEVWNYIDAAKPDLIVSILPPAASDGTVDERDANFGSSLVQSFLHGHASELFDRWNSERVSEMFRREMGYVRARFEFGACYKLGARWGRDWWAFAYIRRDSPHAEVLRAKFASSKRVDNTSDLAKEFAFDPRKLGRAP